MEGSPYAKFKVSTEYRPVLQISLLKAATPPGAVPNADAMNPTSFAQQEPVLRCSIGRCCSSRVYPSPSLGQSICRSGWG